MGKIIQRKVEDRVSIIYVIDSKHLIIDIKDSQMGKIIKGEVNIII